MASVDVNACGVQSAFVVAAQLMQDQPSLARRRILLHATGMERAPGVAASVVQASGLCATHTNPDPATNLMNCLLVAIRHSLRANNAGGDLSRRCRTSGDRATILSKEVWLANGTALYWDSAHTLDASTCTALQLCVDSRHARRAHE
jgi:hypothetical protein